MNVTELARKVRVSTKELFEMLPSMGFDIGRRAIKVDDQVARKIIKQWPEMLAKWEAVNQKKKDEEIKEIVKQIGGPITLPAVIIVRDFAAKLRLPVTKIMSELMKNGILASVNERLDYETAAVVAEDFGFKVQAETATAKEEQKIISQAERLEAIIKVDKKVTSRPPVVVIMGHVDHGKTK